MAKRKTTGSPILLPPSRLTFVHIFDTVKRRDGTEINEITALIPKAAGTDETIDRLNKIIGGDGTKAPLVAALKKVKAENGYSDDDKLKSCIKDGNKPNGKGNIYDGYPDHWVVRAWTKQGPVGVRNAENTEDILDPKELYSGCYGRMTVVPFIYQDEMGQDGFSLFVNFVQKLADGERLGDGGRGNAADQFSAVAKVSDSAENFKTDSSLYEETEEDI